MKFEEIDTKRLTRKILENYIYGYYSSTIVYGKYKNMLFMMKGQNTWVLNLDSKEFVIANMRGFAYPVVDSAGNNYLMVINSECNNNNDTSVVYNKSYQPRYNDTGWYSPYSDEDPHNLECYCNIYDENGKSVHPVNRYVGNIYQITTVLDDVVGDKVFEYKDQFDDVYVFNKPKEWVSGGNLPVKLNKDFVPMLSAGMVWNKLAREEAEEQKYKYKYKMDVVCKYGKYSVIERDTGVTMRFDATVKEVKFVDDVTIILKNNDGFSALYDIHKGYLVKFSDNIIFDSAFKLDRNVWKLSNDSECHLLVNNNILLKSYHMVGVTADKIIMARRLNMVDLYTINGDLMTSIGTSDIYKFDSDLYYNLNAKIYHYNWDTGMTDAMELLTFKSGDGTEVQCNIEEILENYNYYYYDKKTKEFVLFKDKAFGIGFAFKDYARSIKWVNSVEEKQRYLQALLEHMTSMPFDDKAMVSNGKRRIRIKEKI